MVSAKAVKEAIDTMAMLRFFPADGTPVADLLSQMCSNDDQVRWLARRAVALYNEWPGPRELRAVLCSRFKPADGVEAISGVDAQGNPYFPDCVIPSERQIETPTIPALPPGHRFTADRLLEAALSDAVKTIATPKPAKAPPPLPPGMNPVTEDDVFRLKQEQLRTKGGA